MDSLLGFFELGAIILMWTILWNFLIRGITARYQNSAWAQGLAADMH